MKSVSEHAKIPVLSFHHERAGILVARLSDYSSISPSILNGSFLSTFPIYPAEIAAETASRTPPVTQGRATPGCSPVSSGFVLAITLSLYILSNSKVSDTPSTGLRLRPAYPPVWKPHTDASCVPSAFPLRYVLSVR